MTIHDLTSGGYRYLEGVFQYSGGVCALDGYRIERVRFRHMPPIAEGFERIEKHLAGLGLPLTNFCACELRSPAQFTEAGFRSFNEGYVKTLERWGTLRQRPQSRRPQQCLSGDRTPADAGLPCLQLCAAGQIPGTQLRHRWQRRSFRARRQLPRSYRGLWRHQLRRNEGEGALRSR